MSECLQRGKVSGIEIPGSFEGGAEEPVLELRGISKEFGVVKALDQVHLTLRRGRVHALLGENGAGKSTLMKILYGIHSPDSGQILLDGRPAVIKNPLNAIEKGIGMVPQEIHPISNLSIQENIFMGRERLNRWGLLDRRGMEEASREVLRTVNLDLSPRQSMGKLSIAEAQLVTIATAIAWKARILVMDEPTTALTQREVSALYGVIRDLREQGIAVVFISHKMDEVFELSDEITVLRDGRFIHHGPAEEVEEAELIRMMVGRPVDNLLEIRDRDYRPSSEAVLEIENFSSDAFRDIGFKLYRGEVLGIAGLIGAGRSELMETIFGLRSRRSGWMKLHGREVEIRNCSDAIRNRIGFVTEDRRQTGLFLNMSVAENVVMPGLKRYLRWGLLNLRKMRQVVGERIAALRLKTAGTDVLIGTLSGGNQQKALIARWLLKRPDIFIFDEPTRGIDVGSRAEIYTLIREIAREGVSALVVSSDLIEILAVSDRVMVMHEGRKTGELPIAEATQEKIMELATR